jgi:hypothetical protein
VLSCAGDALVFRTILLSKVVDRSVPNSSANPTSKSVFTYLRHMPVREELKTLGY